MRLCNICGLDKRLAKCDGGAICEERSKQAIAKEWVEFAMAVMPKDAPTIQVQEMRRAFYAGAHVMLMLVQQASSVGDEDEGVRKLEAFAHELTRFVEEQ